MALRIDIQRTGDPRWTARVILAGSLDGTTAASLEEALRPLLGSVRHVVFDLADLRFISSAGLRVLLAARKELKAQDGSFAMHRLQPQIVKVFEIVGALPGFDIFTSEKELDDYLAAMQRKYAAPGTL